MSPQGISQKKGKLAKWLGFELQVSQTWHWFSMRKEYSYLLPQPFNSDDNFQLSREYVSVDELNASLKFDQSFDWIIPVWIKLCGVMDRDLYNSAEKKFSTAVIHGDKKIAFEIILRIFFQLIKENKIKS